MKRLGWLAVMALWAGVAAATLPAAPAIIKTQAMTTLAADACLAPAEAITALPGGGLRITCPAHTTLAGLPALFVVDCDRPAGQWRCHRPVLAVRMPVGARSVLLTPRGGSFARAHEVAKTLVDHPWHFNGRNLAQMLQGLCVVEDLGSGAFAGARDYRVRCGERGVVVTRACAQNACRMFPARWDDAA